jgi:hypothetical protein
MSWKHVLDGDYVEALHWGVRALTTFHSIRDFAPTTITLADAAIILLGLGDAENAAIVLRRSTRCPRRRGSGLRQGSPT